MISEDSEFFVSNESGAFPPQLLQETRYCLLYKIRIENRFYVRKQLKPKYATQPAHIFSLKKEFAVGQNLIHPQLISYLFKNEGPDGIVLISAFIEGISLRQAINQLEGSGISFRKALLSKILYPLLNGVKYLHQKNIAHGDLKPENIILTNDETILKIIDLGHAISPEFSVQGGGSPKYQWNESADVAEDMAAYKASDFKALAAILLEIYNGSRHEDGLQKLPPYEKSIVHKLLSGNAPDTEHKLQQFTYFKIFSISVLVLITAATLLFMRFSFSSDKHQSVSRMDESDKQNHRNNVIYHINSEPSASSLNSSKNQANSWAYGFGLRLIDSVLNSEKIKQIKSADEMMKYRNELIVNHHKHWEDTLSLLNINKDKAIYMQLFNDYQRGYFTARKLSDVKFREWTE